MLNKFKVNDTIETVDNEQYKIVLQEKLYILAVGRYDNLLIDTYHKDVYILDGSEAECTAAIQSILKYELILNKEACVPMSLLLNEDCFVRNPKVEQIKIVKK